MFWGREVWGLSFAARPLDILELFICVGFCLSTRVRKMKQSTTPGLNKANALIVLVTRLDTVGCRVH